VKAVILAAGMGKRLEIGIPKPLIKIHNEKTILDFQLATLSNRIGIENVIVVVGYKKELIMEKFPNLTFVYNSNYENTNMAKSLLLALKKIDDDLLSVNGDVYFEAKILDLILKQANSGSLVNIKRCGEEEMKYNIDEDGFIKQISKSLNDHQGEALGMNLIEKKDLNIFRNELQSLADHDFIDKALDNLISRNVFRLMPIYVENLFCHEIDYKSDVEIVKDYLLSPALK